MTDTINAIKAFLEVSGLEAVAYVLWIAIKESKHGRD